MNIDAIKRLTGRIPLDECQTDTRTRACIEFSVRGTPKDRIAMQEKLMKLASELEMDFSFQQDNMYRRMRRLISVSYTHLDVYKRQSFFSLRFGG